MVGVVAKIGEFFASLLLALFQTAATAAAIMVLAVAIMLGCFFAVQYLITQANRRD